MDPRSALAADEGRLTTRQRAVAHLWGWCGWSVEQLGHLFGVSDRTIRRDLRVARAAGAAPRRSRGSTGRIIRQARSLLGTCARLRENAGAASEDPRPNSAGTLWAAALQARLLAEERKLLILIAALPGAARIKLVEPGESGYFVGYCPVLRGCVAQGTTREEAQANLKKAIASYLSVLDETAEEEAAHRHGRREAVHA